MGSWMAASFRPSIGPSSLPVMMPSYSKVQWEAWPLEKGVAGVTRMVPSAERSPVRTLPASSVILVTLSAG